jgi:hypothetical protein
MVGRARSIARSEGLVGRCSRPHSCPHAAAQELVQRIIERRSLQTYWRIAEQLPVASSTIARLLRRAGLHRSAELEPAVSEGRYEYASLGQLLHLRIKSWLISDNWEPSHRQSSGQFDAGIALGDHPVTECSGLKAGQQRGEIFPISVPLGRITVLDCLSHLNRTCGSDAPAIGGKGQHRGGKWQVAKSHDTP